MPKINHEEYELLKSLDDKWKWIARDESGELYTHEENPKKFAVEWVSERDYYLYLGNETFQFIQWEDEEPYNIQELIEEYEKDYKGSWEHAIEFSGEVFGESEETKVKKDIEWLKEEVKKLVDKADKRNQFGSEYTDEEVALESVHKLINQLDEPEVNSQIDKLANFIMSEVEGEPSQNQGAVDTAIRIIKSYQNQEVLTQEWIDENSQSYHWHGSMVPVSKLQNLLVPKQFRDEFNSVLQTLPISSDELLSEFKSFVASGGIKLKQEEITEMNVNDLAYFITQVENEGLIVIEKPEIPQFVAEWYEIEGKQNSWWNWFYKWGRDESRSYLETKTIKWMQDYNEELFVDMFRYGYEVEEEQKYYAKIKGHENIYSDICFWIYDTEIEELLIDDAEIYPDVTAEYMIKATKDEWANLGVNDDNADFVKIKELEE